MKTAFDRWIDYHCNAYPAFARWIADNDAQLAFMRRLLESYSIEQLQAATDSLYASDDQPRGYGEHARKIRQLVVEAGGASNYQERRIGPAVRDDRLVAQCARCMDYGVVSVLSPATLKRVRERSDNHAILTATVACDCGLGRGFARRVKRLPEWSDGHCLVRYEEVLDESCATHRDMWEVACEMVHERDRQLEPQFQDLSAEALP